MTGGAFGPRSRTRWRDAGRRDGHPELVARKLAVPDMTTTVLTMTLTGSGPTPGP